MKRMLPWLLCALLMAGCSFSPPEETTAATAAETAPTEAPGYYDPGSSLEAASGGAVRCYPLTDLNSTSAMPLEDGLLVFSCTERSTTVTLLRGETLSPVAKIQLDMSLMASNLSLTTIPGGFSFYDEASGETCVLDCALQEIQRIPAPEGLMGFPLLSSDGKELYYCTPEALRVLDLDSGISRCLKEMTYDYQYIDGLWLNDTVVECVISTGTNYQTLFLSAETGQLLGSAGDSFDFSSSDHSYYAGFYDGHMRQTIFGSPGEAPEILTPATEVLETHFLPGRHGAVTVSNPEFGQLSLDYYNLSNGFRSSHMELPTEYFPWNFSTTVSGEIGFLNYDPVYGCNVWYEWDSMKTLTGDDSVYTGIYYTRDTPDQAALADCTQYANEIGKKYGIEVCIYKDAAAIEPWDYDLEYEHLPGVLRRELDLLDAHLANYPAGFLPTLADRFQGLRICIVRSLTGSAESGSLDSADGIQFMDGYTACIALAASANTEYALYHELCHLIDTVVLTESGAYDRWDELNPDGFSYDYDYIANASRDSSAYLQDSRRYFIDNYSMSYPKEDRARIMEYAMTEGNDPYFQSATMQKKLRLLCQGIREAFGLEKSPETFLWEQYLHKPLAPTD